MNDQHDFEKGYIAGTRWALDQIKSRPRCDHGGAKCPRIHRQAVRIEDEEKWSMWAAFPLVVFASLSLLAAWAFLVFLFLGVNP